MSFFFKKNIKNCLPNFSFHVQIDDIQQKKYQTILEKFFNDSIKKQQLILENVEFFINLNTVQKITLNIKKNHISLDDSYYLDKFKILHDFSLSSISNNELIITIPYYEQFNLLDIYLKCIYILLIKNVFKIKNISKNALFLFQEHSPNKLLFNSTFFSFEINDALQNLINKSNYLDNMSFPIFSFLYLNNVNSWTCSLEQDNWSILKILQEELSSLTLLNSQQDLHYSVETIFTKNSFIICLNYLHTGTFSHKISYYKTDKNIYITPQLICLLEYEKIQPQIFSYLKNHTSIQKHILFYYLLIEDSFFLNILHKDIINQPLFIQFNISYDELSKTDELSINNYQNSKNLIISGVSGSGKSYRFKKYNEKNYNKIDLTYMKEKDFFYQLINDIFIFIIFHLESPHDIENPQCNLILLDEFNRNESFNIFNKFITLFDCSNGFSNNYTYVSLDKQHFMNKYKNFIDKIIYLLEKTQGFNKFFGIKHTHIYNNFYTFLSTIRKLDQSDELNIPIFLTPISIWWLIINPVDLNIKEFNVMFHRRFQISNQINEKPENLNSDEVFIVEDNKLHSWNLIRNLINNKLSQLDIPSDKHLGYFFWHNSDTHLHKNYKYVNFENFKDKISNYIYYIVLNNGSSINFKYNQIDPLTNQIFSNNNYNSIIQSKSLIELFPFLNININISVNTNYYSWHDIFEFLHKKNSLTQISTFLLGYFIWDIPIENSKGEYIIDFETFKKIILNYYYDAFEINTSDNKETNSFYKSSKFNSDILIIFNEYEYDYNIKLKSFDELFREFNINPVEEKQFLNFIKN